MSERAEREEASAALEVRRVPKEGSMEVCRKVPGGTIKGLAPNSITGTQANAGTLPHLDTSSAFFAYLSVIA